MCSTSICFFLRQCTRSPILSPRWKETHHEEDKLNPRCGQDGLADGAASSLSASSSSTFSGSIVLLSSSASASSISESSSSATLATLSASLMTALASAALSQNPHHRHGHPLAQSSSPFEISPPTVCGRAPPRNWTWAPRASCESCRQRACRCCRGRFRAFDSGARRSAPLPPLLEAGASSSSRLFKRSSRSLEIAALWLLSPAFPPLLPLSALLLPAAALW